jgi:hypothetical protein
MSTLTGNDVYGLMEAYQEVYAPQELTEEQVWEEVETWVNDLIEEGYDLSDYTWEEMFEAYIDEQGRPGSAAVRNQNVNPNASSAIKSAVNSTIGSTPIGFAVRNMASQPPAPPGTGARRGAAPRPQAPSIRDGRNSPPSAQVRIPTAPSKPAAPAARPAAPAPAARPAAPAPAARPAAPAPAKPSGTTPTAKPTPAPSASPARPSLSSQASELRQMRARSLERQGKPLSASFDPFDVIKGHLLDEGYADTEEAALVIMANMSEEWRESIVEEVLDEKKGERPRGLPYGPVGKKFRELTIPQRAAMMKRGKEHTRAAMNSSDEYSGSHAASSEINSALRSPRLGGRG